MFLKLLFNIYLYSCSILLVATWFDDKENKINVHCFAISLIVSLIISFKLEKKRMSMFKIIFSSISRLLISFIGVYIMTSYEELNNVQVKYLFSVLIGATGEGILLFLEKINNKNIVKTIINLFMK